MVAIAEFELHYLIVEDEDVEEQQTKYRLYKPCELCDRPNYLDGLCKKHHDEEWYRLGMPSVIAWRDEVAGARRCVNCGTPIFDPPGRRGPAAKFCKSTCGAAYRKRKIREEQRNDAMHIPTQ